MINSLDNSLLQQHNQVNIQRQNRQSTPERIEILRDSEKIHLDKKLKTFFNPQNQQQSSQQFQPQKQNLMSTMKKSNYDQKWLAYSDQKNTRGIYYRVNVKEIDNNLRQKRFQSNSPNKNSLQFGQLYEQSLKQSIEVYANDNSYLTHDQRLYLQKLLKQEGNENRGFTNSNSNSNLNEQNTQSTNHNGEIKNTKIPNNVILPPMNNSPSKPKGDLLNSSITYTQTEPNLPQNYSGQPNQNSPKSNSPVGNGVKTEGDASRGEKEQYIRQENYRQLWNRLLPYLEKPKFLKNNRQYSQPNQNGIIYPQQLIQMNTQPDESRIHTNNDISLNASEYYQTLNQLDRINQRPLPLIHQTKQQQLLQQQQLLLQPQSKNQVKDKLRDSYYQLDMFANGVRQERSFHQVKNYNGGANNRTQSHTPEKPIIKANSQYQGNGQPPKVNPFLSQQQNGNHQYQQQRSDQKSPNNRYYSNSLHRQQGPSPITENGNDLVKQYKECTELLSLVQVNLSNIVSNMANKKTPKGDFQSRKVQAISSNKADSFSKTIFYDGKVKRKGMEKMILPSLYVTRNSPTMDQNSPNAMQQKSRSSSVLRQDEHIISNEYNNSKTFSHQVPGLEKQQPQNFDDLEYQQDFEDDHSLSRSNVFRQSSQQPSKSQSQQNIQRGGNLTPIQEQIMSRTEQIPQSLIQSQIQTIEKERNSNYQSLDQTQTIISQHNNLVSSALQSPQRSQETQQFETPNKSEIKNSSIISEKSPQKSVYESATKSQQVELQQMSETPQLGLHQDQQIMQEYKEEQQLEQQAQQQQVEVEQIINQQQIDEQQKYYLEQENPQQNTLQQDQQVTQNESQYLEREASPQEKSLRQSQLSSVQMSKQQTPSSKNLQSSQFLSQKSTIRKSRASSSRQSKTKIKDISDTSKNSQSKSPQRQSQLVSPNKNELNASQKSFKKTIDNDKITPTPGGEQSQTPPRQSQTPQRQSQSPQRQSSQSPPKSLNQSQLSDTNKQVRKSIELQKELEKVLSQKAAAAAAAAEEERLRREQEERKRAEELEKEMMKPLFEQIKQLDKEKLKEEIQDFQFELEVNRYTGDLFCRMTFGETNNLKENVLNLKFLKKFDNQRKRVFKIERQMNVFKLPTSLLSNRQFLTEKNKYNQTQFFECTDCCIETKSMEQYNISDFKEFLVTQFINQQIFNGDSRDSSCINISYIGIYHDEEFYQCDTLLIEYEKFETLDEIIADKIANKQPFTEYELLISYLQILNNYQQLIQNNIIHQNINATKIAYSFQDCKFKFMPLAKAHAYNFGNFSPRDTKTDKFMIKGDSNSHPVWIDLVDLSIVFAQMKVLDRAQNKSTLEKINPSDKTISKQIIQMLISNQCETTLNECIELIYQNISSASFLNIIIQPIKFEAKSDFEKCKKMRLIAKTYENIHQLKDASNIFSQLAAIKETVYGKNTDEYFQGLCDQLFVLYKDGQVDQLEPLYQKCSEYFKIIPSLPSSVEYLHYIAEIQWRLGKEQESEEFFDKAFKIISTNEDKIDSRYMTNIFNNKGVNELSRDQFQKSINFFEEAMKYCNQQPQLNKMMLSSILNNYSISLLKMNRLDESLQNMLQSIEVKKEINVLNQDPEGSKMAYAISMLYKQTKNDINKSLEYVDLALQLQEYHQNYLEQLKYIYKKAQLYFEINDQQKAIDSAMEALPYIDKCELATFRQIIQITYDMACLFKNKNLKPQAIAFFSKAHEVGVRIAGPQVLAVQQIKKELDKLK